MPDHPDPGHPSGTIPCTSCGCPTARQWLLAANHCDRCRTVRTMASRLVTWHWDADGLHRRAADPLAALTDLHTARTAINGLIRTVVGHAIDDGVTWAQIGAAVHLDPRDAAARYHRP